MRFAILFVSLITVAAGCSTQAAARLGGTHPALPTLTAAPAGPGTLAVGARDGETVLVAPELPAPAAPRRQRSYALTMVATDLAIAATGPVVAAKTESPVVGVLAVGAYLAAGPIVHLVNGNGSAAGWSLARRVLYPALGFAAGTLIATRGGNNCDGNPCWASEKTLIGIMFGGAVVGAVGAIVHDGFSAHVDVGPATITPVISSDGDRTSIGVAGRF